MLNYIALSWNPADGKRAAIARQLIQRFRQSTPDWLTTLDEDGLNVRCKVDPESRVDRIYPLSSGTGVVLGRLFERTSQLNYEPAIPAQIAFDRERSARVAERGGKFLVDRYWGRYVAFVRSAESHRHWVLRDPTGGIPCQWTQVLGIDVYFVRLEDLERLASLSFTINRHFLLGYLMFMSPRVRETALSEIETVLPGECIEHGAAGRRSEFLWNPLAIAQAGVIQDSDEAARLTRSTVRSCVHAWASCFDGILQSLSGGLDSSIVVSCLADAPTAPRVLCRNFWSQGASSDERFYARLAAKRAGFELIEKELNAAQTRVPTQAPRSLLPVEWAFDAETAAEDDQFARTEHLSAEFTGNGGDEIFFNGGSLPGAVDYAWRHGLGPGCISAAMDDAAADGLSLWRVLRPVIRYGVLKRDWHMRLIGVAPDHMALMSAEMRQQALRDLTLWHPLYREQSRVPPGKFQQAYLLTHGTGPLYDPLVSENVATYHAPLISQPLLELSLRTPLHILRTGGRDRAIARRAFAADLPREIASRKTKGYGNDHVQSIIAQNMTLVRELLLDGFLARERFLDRHKLEDVLSGGISRIQYSSPEVYLYLSVEAWARNWAEFRPTKEFVGHEAPSAPATQALWAVTRQGGA